MARTASGKLLILTVTRACNLRCSYCPTAKDGWPSLSTGDVERALDLFAALFGGGRVKIFGGEPLLVPEVVERALAHAEKLDPIAEIQLSTNGLGLTDEWLDRLDANPKAILAVSIDGKAADHRRFRRSLPGIADSYDRVQALVPRLTRMRRAIVTETIPPASAGAAFENYQHLIELGFRRFNFLPGYYLPWSAAQLTALRASFEKIAEDVRERWRAGEGIYVRNLFTLAPTPFFNTGFVVDSDRTIHASNLGLSADLGHLRERTQVGTLDEPPSIEALAAATRAVNPVLEAALSPDILTSTRAADAELTRFCRSLYGSFRRYRRLRAA